jgi:hypothetical protein
MTQVKRPFSSPAYEVAPECEDCGMKMIPIWFEEEETITDHGVLVETGRRRTAVSHFECPSCGAKEPVDDSLDGPWHY